MRNSFAGPNVSSNMEGLRTREVAARGSVCKLLRKERGIESGGAERYGERGEGGGWREEGRDEETPAGYGVSRRMVLRVM